MYRFACVVLAATALLLAGCYPVRDTSRPPAVRLLAAPRPAQRVVIVLPGIADNLASLEAGGIGRAVQGAWPDADVVLVEMTIGYYKDGRAMPDLHQIIGSAREKGYRKVWLVGASLGGMGAILYDTTFPCDVDGIVLLAPFLGDRRTLDEIRNAGGLDRWAAPPAATPGPDNWQLQIWRRAKLWSSHPRGDARVWLAYGDRDKFAPNMSLLSSAVPPDHVITAPGVHEWTSWTPIASKVFADIDLETSSMAASLLPPVSETCIKD